MQIRRDQGPCPAGRVRPQTLTGLLQAPAGIETTALDRPQQVEHVLRDAGKGEIARKGLELGVAYGKRLVMEPGDAFNPQDGVVRLEAVDRARTAEYIVLPAQFSGRRRYEMIGADLARATAFARPLQDGVLAESHGLSISGFGDMAHRKARHGKGAP